MYRWMDGAAVDAVPFFSDAVIGAGEVGALAPECFAAVVCSVKFVLLCTCVPLLGLNGSSICRSCVVRT